MREKIKGSKLHDDKGGLLREDLSKKDIWTLPRDEKLLKEMVLK